MTTSEPLSAQAEAGARYTKAIAEFHAAYVELAALDAALANGNSGHCDYVPSFGPMSPIPSGLFAHPVFAPDVTVGLWSDESTSRRNTIISQFK